MPVSAKWKIFSPSFWGDFKRKKETTRLLQVWNFNSIISKLFFSRRNIQITCLGFFLWPNWSASNLLIWWNFITIFKSLTKNERWVYLFLSGTRFSVNYSPQFWNSHEPIVTGCINTWKFLQFTVVRHLQIIFLCYNIDFKSTSMGNITQIQIVWCNVFFTHGTIIVIKFGNLFSKPLTRHMTCKHVGDTLTNKSIPANFLVTLFTNCLIRF